MSIKIDQYQIYPTIFPDGTSQVWKLPDAVLGHEKVVIEWEFSHEGEFMHLAQLKALLDSFAIEASLRLPYLPYGRQDKDIDNRKTFALLTFANLLNSLLFRSITIIDPHSHIAELMIDRSSAIYPVDELNIVRTKCKSDLVCYPDKGAVTKYVKIYTDFDWVHGEKVRDQESGHILSYELVGSVAGKNVLNPVKIVTGWTKEEFDEAQRIGVPVGGLESKGAIECLWETFGGTVNEQGYKVLDPHIGLIYGDAITFERAKSICERLKAKGFASTNVVFGIGSFSYQYNTRDTFGFALKSTFNIRNNSPVMIFKNPKTDDGTKKSQRGRVEVIHGKTSIKLIDGYDNLDHAPDDLLQTVFRDGELLVDWSFSDIRGLLRQSGVVTSAAGGAA